MAAEHAANQRKADSHDDDGSDADADERRFSQAFSNSTAQLQELAQSMRIVVDLFDWEREQSRAEANLTLGLWNVCASQGWPKPCGGSGSENGESRAPLPMDNNLTRRLDHGMRGSRWYSVIAHDLTIIVALLASDEIPLTSQWFKMGCSMISTAAQHFNDIRTLHLSRSFIHSLTHS